MIVSDAPKHLDGEAQLISKLILKNVKLLMTCLLNLYLASSVMIILNF